MLHLVGQLLKKIISDARNHKHKIPRLCLGDMLLYLLLRNINEMLQETYFLFPFHTFILNSSYFYIRPYLSLYSSPLFHI